MAVAEQHHPEEISRRKQNWRPAAQPRLKPEQANENGISLFTALLLPEMTEWNPVLERLGISFETALWVASRAASHGTNFQTELMVSRLVTEQDFYRAIADDLGVLFQEKVAPTDIILHEKDHTALLRRQDRGLCVRMESRDAGAPFLFAPDLASVRRLRELCENDLQNRQRIRIVAPTVLRQALLWRLRPVLTERATSGLSKLYADYSAKIVLSGWQAYAAGALTVLLPVALFTFFHETMLALHILGSLLFLACVALRMMAVWWVPSAVPVARPGPLSRDRPVYSVLVALYQEADVVPELLVSLSKIVWPRSKLEIKLICEEDDAETIAAITAHPLRDFVEVVIVPTSIPRTKPKALDYALSLTSGEFVVLYDAEDHPHPLQLAEAWQRFRDGPPELACLQAPLEVTNRSASGIALMFAFEYAALFRRMLPWLESKRLMLPLGGTSNHFRRCVLEDVGAWDPHNVTEDADLGLRLSRFGYSTGTLTYPTQEDGPEDFRTWLPQRTRWFKGWLQTWLVHMRNPAELWSDMEKRSFFVAQILFAGMAFSALVHPMLVVTAIWLMTKLIIGSPFSVLQSSLLVIDAVNITLGYLSFILLGRAVLRKTEKRDFWKVCLLTPVYWMMLSFAAWRAVFKLVRKPHEWEKTPHRARSLRRMSSQ
jgi:cellulose synthase/poly-beta-1,6-N-acetylglucosamine synthase-like glycosyltransferase